MEAAGAEQQDVKVGVDKKGSRSITVKSSSTKPIRSGGRKKEKMRTVASQVSQQSAGIFLVNFRFLSVR